MIAYNNDFKMLLVLTVVVAPLLLLLRKTGTRPDTCAGRGGCRVAAQPKMESPMFKFPPLPLALAALGMLAGCTVGP